MIHCLSRIYYDGDKLRVVMMFVIIKVQCDCQEEEEVCCWQEENKGVENKKEIAEISFSGRFNRNWTDHSKTKKRSLYKFLKVDALIFEVLSPIVWTCFVKFQE